MEDVIQKYDRVYRKPKATLFCVPEQRFTPLDVTSGLGGGCVKSLLSPRPAA